MDSFGGMSAKDAREFAGPWLEAWHGNDPERLCSFYGEDSFYADPAVPEGLRGSDEIRPYFKRLLAANPEWVWRHERSVPLEDGFLNFWVADIPQGREIVRCRGVCTVQLQDGLIRRNEVFFDRSALLRPGVDDIKGR